MKKHTEPIQDDDPIDGAKAVGCLFIGIALLAIIISAVGWIINQLR